MSVPLCAHVLQLEYISHWWVAIVPTLLYDNLKGGWDRMGWYFRSDDHSSLRSIAGALLVASTFLDAVERSIPPHHCTASRPWLPHWLYLCTKSENVCWSVLSFVYLRRTLIICYMKRCDALRGFLGWWMNQILI